ncbi:MAG: hypothetical protein WDN66_05405 [Candidatus Saccharibacteria bacterium]
MGATDEAIDEWAVLFGTYDQEDRTEVSYLDPNARLITLYAGAIANQSEVITANLNDCWTRQADEDQLSTAFNVVLAQNASRAALASITEEHIDRLQKGKWHKSDDKLTAVAFLASLGAATAGELSVAANATRAGQIAIGAVMGGVVATLAFEHHILFKDPGRHDYRRAQALMDHYSAIDFTDSLEAAHMFGARKVIDVAAPDNVVELKSEITDDAPVAS